MWIYYTAFSSLTFLAWGIDKFRARANQWRISERTLLSMVWLGGAFGALLGMLFFRHKTRKPLFWTAVLAGSILHAVIIFLLFIYT